MAEIAWIGLGTMGVPMAKNLAAAGHHVMGIDVSAHARQRAGEAGIEVVEEMADAVAAAEFVFTMLPKGEHVRSVYEGEKGVLAQISRGRWPSILRPSISPPAAGATKRASKADLISSIVPSLEASPGLRTARSPS